MAKFFGAALPGFDLEVQSGGEMIQPDLGAVEADPAWRYVDRNGHGHFFQDGQERYPTLTWVSEPCTMGHGDDCDAEGHYECGLCQEEVRPGTRPAQAFWVDGPNTYRLTVAVGGQLVTYAFGEDQWTQLQTKLVDTVHSSLGDFVVEVASR